MRLYHCFAIVGLTLATGIQAEQTVIRFDLPPTVAAHTVATDSQMMTAECELRISSLVASPDAPKIDQWLVQCQPRDASIVIVDYAPKTEAQSDIEGPIQFKISDEQSGSLGLSLDGSYLHSVRGSLGADRGNKHTDSRQYSRTPQLHAVTAAGTINRGRGVYFKLRRSAKQILEGEKIFRVTLRVPKHWRGSLLDVSVVAQSLRKSLGGWDRKIKTLGASQFVVAAYNKADVQAADISRRLADAEQSLRELSIEQPAGNASLTTWLHQIATKLELEKPATNNRPIQRVLAGAADPYLDKDIRQLPMPTRLAVLEYCDRREEFDQLTQRQECNSLAAGTHSHN